MAKLADEVHNLVGIFLVEIPGGFVHEKIRNVSNERSRDGDALLFAARKLERIALFFSKKPHPSKNRFGIEPPGEPVQPERQLNVVFDRKVRYQMELLKNESDVFSAKTGARVFVERRDVCIVEKHAPRIGNHESRSEVQ